MLLGLSSGRRPQGAPALLPGCPNAQLGTGREGTGAELPLLGGGVKAATDLSGQRSPAWFQPDVGSVAGLLILSLGKVCCLPLIASCVWGKKGNQNV